MANKNFGCGERESKLIAAILFHDCLCCLQLKEEFTFKKHVLPGDDGDTVWFDKLNPFEQQETRRQVNFKRTFLSIQDDGVWAKRPGYSYPHILPNGNIEKVFYTPEMAKEVLSYCQENYIALHTEALNLRSSQVSCFNVLFPLRQDLSLALVALTPVLPGVKQVDNIEFEYTGPSASTQWLGEPAGGQRGQNRTSIDAAMWWRDADKRYLTLVEWKYTERGYGSCGGYRSRGNEQKHSCENLDVRTMSQDECFLTHGRNTRRYWEHLGDAGIDINILSTVKGCPFRGPFYQLMRQYLLAAYLRRYKDSEEVGKVDEVFVATVGFRGNTSMHQVPDYLKHLGSTAEGAWNSLLGNAPALKFYYANDIVDALKLSDRDDALKLTKYLEVRYGI